MLSFKQFLHESINDKGILKAVFVIGLPGAGKSYATRRISGSISPVIVNTDKAAEFLSTKKGVRISAETWHEHFNDSAMRITANMLSSYLNSLLPLFIDGTSNDVSRIMHRIGILESIGYDVGVVHVRADLETALKRAKERGENGTREVDEDFIRMIHQLNDDNVEYLKSKTGFFREIDNSGNTLTDASMLAAYKAVQAFFSEDVKNIVGKRTLNKLREEKQGYLTPSIMSQQHLKNLVQGWYK